MADTIRSITTEDRVLRVIDELMTGGGGADGIRRDLTPREQDPYFDSLYSVELVMALEDEFSIQITDEDAERLDGAIVQGYIDYIVGRGDIS